MAFKSDECEANARREFMSSTSDWQSVSYVMRNYRCLKKVLSSRHWFPVRWLVRKYWRLCIKTDPQISLSTTKVFVNGFVCKDPKLANPDDFSSSGLDKPGDTMNRVGSKVTLVSAVQLPGLNTLGISLARIDYGPNGLNAPHTHPRASEILTVLEGTLCVGFVTSNPDNKLFAKVLNKGDVFVFPQGLIHFQFNPTMSNAVAIASLSSQNPGTITIANAVFGAKPPISDDVLAKAFQLDKKTVDWLQAQFWTDN